MRKRPKEKLRPTFFPTERPKGCRKPAIFTFNGKRDGGAVLLGIPFIKGYEDKCNNVTR